MNNELLDNILVIINSNWFSGLIGALIGGCFSLWATNKSHKHQRKLIAEQEEQATKDYISSIRSELNILYKMFADDYDSIINNDQPSLKIRFNTKTDFLAVYNNNLDKIGCVGDIELREKIIACYKTAELFSNVLEMNNFVLREFEDNEKLENVNSCAEGKSYFKSLRNNRDEELQKIKENQLVPTYNKLKEQMEELLPLLKNENSSKVK